MSHGPSEHNDPSADSPRRPANKSAPNSPKPGLPNWLTFATLAIAVIAVVIGVGGWFRPSTGPGKFSDEETANAKAKVCSVSQVVRQAVGINTHRNNPEQGDPGAALGVAANARLALYGGGAYLERTLADEPATPSDLADAATAYANTVEELGINYLAEAPDSAQQPLRDKLNSQIDQLNESCKG